MAKRDEYEAGTTALRKWYYSEIRDLAKEALKEGRKNDEEALTEWVEQTIDGHEFVIYTAKAMAVLLASDHHDAYFEEMGETAPPGDGDVEWSKLAYFAMVRDVREQIDAERR